MTHNPQKTQFRLVDLDQAILGPLNLTFMQTGCTRRHWHELANANGERGRQAMDTHAMYMCREKSV
jgi:hypothetical protein